MQGSAYKCSDHSRRNVDFDNSIACHFLQDEFLIMRLNLSHTNMPSYCMVSGFQQHNHRSECQPVGLTTALVMVLDHVIKKQAMKEASHDRGVYKLVTVPSSFTVFIGLFFCLWEVAGTHGKELWTYMQQRSQAGRTLGTLQLMVSALNHQPPEHPNYFSHCIFLISLGQNWWVMIKWWAFLVTEIKALSIFKLTACFPSFSSVSWSITLNNFPIKYWTSGHFKNLSKAAQRIP